MRAAWGDDGAIARRRIPRDLEIERERVRARHGRAVEGDYFQALGVSRAASPHEVRSAHARLIAETSPEAIDPELMRQLTAELETIREVADEALRVLGAPTLRAQYEAALPPEEGP